MVYSRLVLVGTARCGITMGQWLMSVPPKEQPGTRNLI